MFRNLKAEIVRKGLTYEQLAVVVGKNRDWIEKRVHGKVVFPINDGILIRNEFFPNMDYDYLFAQESA